MSLHTVLVTKQIDPGLILKAKKEDVELKEIPLTEIVSREEKKQIDDIAKQPASVVFTSKNAVKIVHKSLGRQHPQWKIYCIDGGTRDQVAALFGEASIAGTAINAQQLAELIVERSDDHKLFFFCGERRRHELPDAIRHHEKSIEEIVVYDTRLLAEPIGQHFDGIVFFSPSAAESFFSANVVDDITVFFAIGDTTADALKKYANNKIIISPIASEEAMVDTILSFIKKNNDETKE